MLLAESNPSFICCFSYLFIVLFVDFHICQRVPPRCILAEHSCLMLENCSTFVVTSKCSFSNCLLVCPTHVVCIPDEFGYEVI